MDEDADEQQRVKARKGKKAMIDHVKERGKQILYINKGKGIIIKEISPVQPIRT